MPRTKCVLIVMLLSLTSCAGQIVYTPVSIAARETIVLESKAQFGRILNNDRDMSWENFPVHMFLTPTTLYVTAKNFSMPIAYNVIDKAEVRDVPFWLTWPFGEPRLLPELLVVETPHAQCWHGCVFRFDQSAFGYEAARTISLFKNDLDPFGRLDGPREFWLLTQTQASRHHWSPEPKFLLRNFPELVTGMDALLAARVQFIETEFPARIEKSLNQLFTESADRLNRWQPRHLKYSDLTGVYDYFQRAAFLLEQDSAINSELSISLASIQLAEKISANYEPEVELRFSISIGFRDLLPSKQGLLLRTEHTARHSVEEWTANDGALLDHEVRQAASLAAHKIYSQL